MRRGLPDERDWDAAAGGGPGRVPLLRRVPGGVPHRRGRLHDGLPHGRAIPGRIGGHRGRIPAGPSARREDAAALRPIVEASAGLGGGLQRLRGGVDRAWERGVRSQPVRRGIRCLTEARRWDRRDGTGDRQYGARTSGDLRRGSLAAPGDRGRCVRDQRRPVRRRGRIARGRPQRHRGRSLRAWLPAPSAHDSGWIACDCWAASRRRERKGRSPVRLPKRAGGRDPPIEFPVRSPRESPPRAPPRSCRTIPCR